MSKPDLVGRRFDRLVVESEGVPYVNGRRSYVRWLCLCDCGGRNTVTTSRLLSGKTQSCGCKRSTGGTRTHGHTAGKHNSGTYNSWQDMVRRCTDPSDEAWDNYGGRGISVCERWRAFGNFLADMCERPEGRTLERINNNGNYEPGNARWATRQEQARNTRATRLTADLVRQIRASSESSYQWSIRLGCSYSAVKVARSGRTWAGV